MSAGVPHDTPRVGTDADWSATKSNLLSEVAAERDALAAELARVSREHEELLHHAVNVRLAETEKEDA